MYNVHITILFFCNSVLENTQDIVDYLHVAIVTAVVIKLS